MLILRAAGIYAVLAILHAADLSMPYFWDEMGHFVPVARDLLATGDPVPHSVQPNPHPPLVPATVALGWKLFGASIPVARFIMLGWAAAACWGAYALSARLAPPGQERAAGGIAAVCLAVYPVFFAQSPLVQLDLPSAALTLWALVGYADRRLSRAALLLTLAVLAKESAAVCAATLALIELVWPPPAEASPARRARAAAQLLLPVAALAIWLAYFRARTGSFTGSAEWTAFNASAALLSPARLAAAGLLRLWHATAHVFLVALTAPALVAALALARRGVDWQSNRLPLVLGCCAAAYVAAFSLLGGAVLARYMLPSVALVIVLSAAALAAFPRGRWIAGAFALLAFGAGLAQPPPYHCAFDDTLLYRDFVRLHREAASYLAASGQGVITTWPATDELLRPENGYVVRPLHVIQVDDLTPAQVNAARRQCPACLIFTFPTQYEPPADGRLRPGRWLRGLAFWRGAQRSFVVRAGRTGPAELAAAVGAEVAWSRQVGSLTAAVLKEKE
ncbi:MAG: glycosyltransferase family 39 protein [Bryobacterales bacterium]|nr:glycosyltransferase family 39 protein [Bryobacterales bacterium]